MQKMITAIRLSRPQPPGLIFTPPLPSNLGRKATGVRFKQVASVHVSSENSSMDQQQEEPTLRDQQQEEPTLRTGDILLESFGVGYASRCEDEGFGGIYGAKTEQAQLIHDDHPPNDKSPGSEVKEEEKARHKTSASA